jgi:DNA-directed RNA polymerase specialized sigma24 family protein
MWLIRVTARECLRWRRQEHPYGAREDADKALALAEAEGPMPEEMLRQLGDEQMLRDAVRGLAPRCRELIGMLFFEDPPRPYAEVARSLGLAGGSIGFIRGRCLARLRRTLEKAGFR